MGQTAEKFSSDSSWRFYELSLLAAEATGISLK